MLREGPKAPEKWENVSTALELTYFSLYTVGTQTIADPEKSFYAKSSLSLPQLQLDRRKLGLSTSVVGSSLSLDMKREACREA